jgi:hypothetical protein
MEMGGWRNEQEKLAMDTPDENHPEAMQAGLALDRVREALEVLATETPGERASEAVRHGIEAAGGCILFDLTLGEDEAAEWTAAIAFEDEEEPRVAILTLKTASGEMSLEPAEASENPVAALATSYAGFAEQWGRAAA